MRNILPVGIVIIGRNEGERLRICLESCLGRVETIVYVDSGSSDGSVEMATGLGVDVLALDTFIRFTAARARNEGAKRLKELNPSIKYIQFVDGDCEFVDGWLLAGMKQLEERADATIVCGRLRERYPEASVYNRICDIEWNCLTGEVTACGGIFMMRIDIFDKVGGFNADIIAGEEPELCLRVRRDGGKILRLSVDMAWHDAAMLFFGQWWCRAIRSGHAFAEGVAMYGLDTEKYCVRETVRIWLWSVVLPGSILLSTFFLNFWSLLLLSLYPLQTWRIAQSASYLNSRSADCWLYAMVCIGAKWPEMLGQLRFWKNRLRRKKTRIIEYK